MSLPHQPILGLIDGIEVLQFLSASAKECSGTLISKELGIEKTKVNRILKTLAYLGLAHQNNGRKYTLGPAIHILSAQTLHGSGLINHSLKHLVELTKLDVVVAMGVLWRDKVSYLYHWESGLPLSEGLGRVDVFPATQSSIGLILLAQQTNEQILTIMSDKPIPGYKSTKALLDHIEQIRSQKYAVTKYHERNSIAVRVGDPAFAAVALADDSPDWPEDAYYQALKETVKSIEESYQQFNKTDTPMEVAQKSD